jgi:hypothetical protein
MREGTLRLQEDLANRSLTLAEVETLRAFNEAFKAKRLGKALHTRVMRIGVAPYMKARVPGPGERRIETPQWALDRAGEIEREVVERIAGSGVRVIGDLDRLTEVPASGLEGDVVPPPEIAPPIAASLAMGLLVASGLARRSIAAPATPAGAVEPGTPAAAAARPGEPPAIARVPTRKIGSILYRRARAAGTDRWSTTRRRIGTALGGR